MYIYIHYTTGRWPSPAGSRTGWAPVLRQGTGSAMRRRPQAATEPIGKCFSKPVILEAQEVFIKTIFLEVTTRFLDGPRRPPNPFRILERCCFFEMSHCTSCRAEALLQTAGLRNKHEDERI